MLCHILHMGNQSEQLYARNSQHHVRQTRQVSVKIFKTLRLQYHCAILCGTSPAYSMGLGTQLPASTILNFCPWPCVAAHSLPRPPSRPPRRSTLGDCAFPVASARAWNSLPSSVRNAPSLTTFRRELKTVLFRSSFDND